MCKFSSCYAANISPTTLQGSNDIIAVQVPDSNSTVDIHTTNAEMKPCKCENSGMSLRNVHALHA